MYQQLDLFGTRETTWSVCVSQITRRGILIEAASQKDGTTPSTPAPTGADKGDPETTADVEEELRFLREPEEALRWSWRKTLQVGACCPV